MEWTPYIVATGLAGILAPFLTHVTKTVLGVDSLRAYALHLICSALTAIAALAVTGDITLATFFAKFPQIALISATAFATYKALSGLRISPSPTVPTEDTPPPPDGPVAP